MSWTNSAGQTIPAATAGNDTFTGTAAAETANGLAGNDTLLGQGGNDTLYGGDDLLQGSANDDLLDGGAGWDTASYADGTDSIIVRVPITDGGSGSDTLLNIENGTFSGFADFLTSSMGSDLIEGCPGDDCIEGRGFRTDLALNSCASAPTTVTVCLASSDYRRTSHTGPLLHGGRCDSVQKYEYEQSLIRTRLESQQSIHEICFVKVVL